MSGPVDVLAARRARLVQRMLHADTHGSNALANGNACRESGKVEQAERYYEKGQYWLDESNRCRDKITEIDALAHAGSAP